jgi:hypothetical protein
MLAVGQLSCAWFEVYERLKMPHLRCGSYMQANSTTVEPPCVYGTHASATTGGTATTIFFVGYKGGKIYWLAIHSNQANLIVGGLRHRRHNLMLSGNLSLAAAGSD